MVGVQPLDNSNSASSTNVLSTWTPTTTIEWIVRPARIQDGDAVDYLLKSAYTDLLSKDYEPDVLAKALPILTRSQPHLLTCPTWFVAEHPIWKGIIVGCGGYTVDAPSFVEHSMSTVSVDAVVPHLRHFATDPAYARQGIGRALWNRIWRDVRATLGEITAMQVVSTVTAKPFYESLGFVSVRKLDVPLSKESSLPGYILRRDTDNK